MTRVKTAEIKNHGAKLNTSRQVLNIEEATNIFLNFLSSKLIFILCPKKNPQTWGINFNLKIMFK